MRAWIDRLLVAALLVLPAVARAKPYDDTQSRFSIDVPEGWSFEPRFGDTQGMAWKRALDAGRAVTLSVHIDAIEAPDFKSYVKQVESELGAAHTRLEKKLGDVGGRHAVLMEYGPSDKTGGDPLARLRAYFLEVSGHRYHLIIDGQRNDLRRLDKELAAILKSFTPKAGVASEAAERASRGKKPVDSALLVGKWINEDKLVMVLHAEGGFSLGDAKGRYEVAGRTLVFILPGQGRESFTFTLDDGGDLITLASENLEKPMAYHRIGGGGGGGGAEGEEGEGAEEAAPAPAGGGPVSMIGRWSTPLKNGTLVLDLTSKGGFTMGKMRGRWAVDQERLTLTGTHGEVVSYRFEAVGDTLRLSGGDLEEPRTFRKLVAR